MQESLLINLDKPPYYFESELQKPNGVREGQYLRFQTYFPVNSTFHYASLIIHSSPH